MNKVLSLDCLTPLSLARSWERSSELPRLETGVPTDPGGGSLELEDDLDLPLERQLLRNPPENKKGRMALSSLRPLAFE